MSSFRSWNTMYFRCWDHLYLFYARWGLFHFSSGMIYFFLFNTFSVYIMDLLLKRYRKSVSPTTEKFAKDFLITATSRMEKVFDILHSPSLYHGGTDWCHRHGRYGFHPFGCTGGAGSKMNFVTKEVVDEVFINLPSEDYNISDFVSEFESMGIDVTVNLNAFNFASLGNKRVREVGGLSVVTFQPISTSRATYLPNVFWTL